MIMGQNQKQQKVWLYLCCEDLKVRRMSRESVICRLKQFCLFICYLFDVQLCNCTLLVGRLSGTTFPGWSLNCQSLASGLPTYM